MYKRRRAEKSESKAKPTRLALGLNPKFTEKPGNRRKMETERKRSHRALQAGGIASNSSKFGVKSCSFYVTDTDSVIDGNVRTTAQGEFNVVAKKTTYEYKSQRKRERSPWDFDLGPACEVAIIRPSGRSCIRSSKPSKISSQETETMRLEMEYLSDRAWYETDEGQSSLFDVDFDPYMKKKEAELAKRLVRRDGSTMSLAQSKKFSQLHTDNAQWEDRQFLRSGAVRGTAVLETQFDCEEERKAVLLVHDTKPPFLDGRVVYTKQADPVMPVKDPTSDMAIISRKGQVL